MTRTVLGTESGRHWWENEGKRLVSEEFVAFTEKLREGDISDHADGWRRKYEFLSTDAPSAYANVELARRNEPGSFHYRRHALQAAHQFHVFKVAMLGGELPAKIKEFVADQDWCRGNFVGDPQRFGTEAEQIIGAGAAAPEQVLLDQ